MALSKDILGQALYDNLTSFNNKDIVQTGNIEAARLAFCKKMAESIIDHFKNNIIISIPGAGLTAGPTAVTGVSITGTIT